MAYQIIQQFCSGGNGACKLKNNGKTVECSNQQTADVVYAPVGGTVTTDQSGNIIIKTTTGDNWTLSKFNKTEQSSRVDQNQKLGNPIQGNPTITLTLIDNQGNRGDITPYWNYDQNNQRSNQRTVPTASRFENQPELWRNAVSAASAPQRIALQGTVGLIGQGLKKAGQGMQTEQTLSNNNLDSLILEEIERIKELLK